MHYVYILKSEVTKRFYIGCTNNLDRRIGQHNAGENKSTKKGKPWTLIVFREFEEQELAYKEEKRVKSFKGGNAFKKLINGEVAEWSKAAHC